MKLTKLQRNVLAQARDGSLFLRGPAGCGKTTLGVQRMLDLLEAGTPAGSILLLTPQRTLQEPYIQALRSGALAPGGEVTPATLGGLARRMTDLFWPLAAEGGFADPSRAPTFLTIETAQYYMASIVRPLLEQGYFESVTMERNRLYSQILDNLNKAALIGFPVAEIAARLTTALNPAERDFAVRRRIYEDAQDCAVRFRAFCLQYSLLDFSLQMELFTNVLWPQEAVRAYLTRTYRHLIYDNVEEDPPRTHDLLLDWLPDFESILLLYDDDGGYRRFLGADPESGLRLAAACEQTALLDESFVVGPEVEHLAHALATAIAPDAPLTPLALTESPADKFPLDFSEARFFPQMLDQVVDEVGRLITDEGFSPAEVVVLAPYVSDSLRFSLTNRLDARGIPWRSHRPSRSLRDEPATQALLTLAALAHPAWEVRPTKFDVAYALMQVIDGIDLVRAQLLADIVVRLPHSGPAELSAFEQIKPDVQERITFVHGGHYSELRAWIETYRAGAPLPLDHFLRKLFGELLSQPGFGFHRNLDAARVTASLIESVQKFRWVFEPVQTGQDVQVLGREYVAMLQEGVIAAQYLESWRSGPDEAVLVAPAYTFLMGNRPARAQFWLDVGSAGWSERVYQPLTHPYVLSRSWQNDPSVGAGRPWLDSDEVAANRATLARLVAGLLRRCRGRVYLGLSELGEQGYEQRAMLLKAFQKVLQA